MGLRVVSTIATCPNLRNYHLSRVRSAFNVTAKSSLSRRRIAAGLVSVAVLLLTGMATAVVAGTDTNADSRGVVLFVGDSNVTVSAAAIVFRMTLWDHYNNAYIPVLAPRVGANIRTYDCREPTGCTSYNYWEIKLRDTFKQIHPDAIVNDLGINDTVHAGTQGTPGYAFYGKKIDWFMHLIPNDTLVFWTNLPCSIEPVGRLNGCKAVNTALAAARPRWTNLILVNWAARAGGHPEYLARANGKPDVHNSPVGASAWIAQVTSVMDARLPPN